MANGVIVSDRFRRRVVKITLMLRYLYPNRIYDEADVERQMLQKKEWEIENLEIGLTFDYKHKKAEEAMEILEASID